MCHTISSLGGLTCWSAGAGARQPDADAPGGAATGRQGLCHRRRRHAVPRRPGSRRPAATTRWRRCRAPLPACRPVYAWSWAEQSSWTQLTAIAGTLPAGCMSALGRCPIMRDASGCTSSQGECCVGTRATLACRAGAWGCRGVERRRSGRRRRRGQPGLRRRRCHSRPGACCGQTVFIPVVKFVGKPATRSGRQHVANIALDRPHTVSAAWLQCSFNDAQN